MSLQTIDVAIGMVFLYLLLTLISSTLVEVFSSLRNWRGEMLYGAVKNLLYDTPIGATDVYLTPFIQSLARNQAAKSPLDLFEKSGWCLQKDITPPSYIPATAFSSAVLYILWTLCRDENHDLPIDRPEETARAIGKFVDKPGHSRDSLQAIIVTTLATQGPSIQAVRLAIEKSFNDSMDRVSGWYKRRTQSCLLILGIVGALAANIDSINIVKWLWNSDASRQAVVTAAIDLSKQTHPPQPISPNAAGSDDKMHDLLNQLSEDVIYAGQRFSALKLPIGWERFHLTFEWFVQYLMGCLISGIAISVGSSFWFDTLQSLLKIRATGPRPNN